MLSSRFPLALSVITALFLGTTTLGAPPSALASSDDALSAFVGFSVPDGWKASRSAEPVPNRKEIQSEEDPEGPIRVSGGRAGVITSNESYGDCIVRFEIAIPKNTDTGIFLMGRYEIGISKELREAWHEVEIRFRAPRLNEFGQIRENPLLLRASIDGETIRENVAYEEPSKHHPNSGVDIRGPLAIRGDRGPIAIRSLIVETADFENISETQERESTKAIVDYVQLGKEAFANAGCTECHATAKGDPSVKTGPTLFGLFGEIPRLRAIVDASGKDSVRVRADETYYRNSLRNSISELAVAESGGNKGRPYEPLMPPSPVEVISPLQLDAIYRYLQTLNSPGKAGPPVYLARNRVAAPEDPMTSYHEILVTDQPRAVRARVQGQSSRAVHVGLENGFNYAFDPRVLSVLDVWWGGFLNLKNEHTGRANSPSRHGTGAQLIHRERALLAPLDDAGKPIDFSYRENVAGDTQQQDETIHDTVDFLDRMSTIDADFLGYTAGPGAEPAFRYRVGENTIGIRFSGDRHDRYSTVRFRIDANLKTPQSFAIDEALRGPVASAGEIREGRWELGALGETTLTLTARLKKPDSSVWRPAIVPTELSAQPVVTEVTKTALLPAGYTAETLLPPRDTHGRKQLFEATGLAIAEDGTAIVATRTAGIWRLRNDEWRLFSDIVLDPMGVWIEDASGDSIVIAQKPEVTRIRDTDGDGFADSFETVCDEFGFHENYHSYNHGPVRDAEGNYYFALNLAHGGYKAASPFMGSTGGYRGWLCRVTPDGQFQPWASGLRSPAGLSIDGQGQIWYTENQGEFNGTSKLFRVEEGSFFGSTNSLIDRPGMIPDAPDISWDEVKASRVTAAALFPHGMLANAPGHPAWDTTDGRFSNDPGRMYVGDQTLSSIFTVQLSDVGGNEQACCIPFAKGMPSGVMRIAFDDQNRMLVGQTGRGWRARGGQLDGLVRIRWDGKTVPVSIHAAQIEADTAQITLSHPLTADTTNETIAKELIIESWYYQDSPNYGSPTHDRQREALAADDITIDDDRRIITVRRTAPPSETNDQGQRAYRIALPAKQLENGAESALPDLEAFITVNS